MCNAAQQCNIAPELGTGILSHGSPFALVEPRPLRRTGSEVKLPDLQDGISRSNSTGCRWFFLKKTKTQGPANTLSFHNLTAECLIHSLFIHFLNIKSSMHVVTEMKRIARIMMMAVESIIQTMKTGHTFSTGTCNTDAKRLNELLTRLLPWHNNEYRLCTRQLQIAICNTPSDPPKNQILYERDSIL